MVIMEKSRTLYSKLKTQAPSLESFEETYKTAYTHGLEAIYSLENVDLKSVRKIQVAGQEEKPPKNVSYTVEEESELTSCQEELDLGEKFQEWIEPYIKDEPIQVLGLSFQADASIRECGLKRISDLLLSNFSDHAFLKKIGQGHINEIREKLEVYLSGRSLKKTKKIDFRSLLLASAAGVDLKKLAYFLKSYHLSEIVPLTPLEKMDLKAKKGVKDLLWKEEVEEKLQDVKEEYKKQLKKITEVFIAPWMMKRGGLASQDEVIERVEMVSAFPEMTGFFLEFIKDNFTSGRFPFAFCFYEPEDQVFCCNETLMKSYGEILEKALKYFYKPSVCYPFDKLVFYLLREFAKEWKDYKKEFVEACLKKSEKFDLLKDCSETLVIVLR